MEITVSLETYKALTQLLQHEQDTYDAVIWRAVSPLVGKGTVASAVAAPLPADMARWFENGVEMPVGTQLRRRYKGQEYIGTVEKNGLVVQGKQYPSLSSAACAIAEYNVNGWAFWNYQNPKNGKWEPIGTLRGE